MSTQQTPGGQVLPPIRRGPDGSLPEWRAHVQTRAQVNAAQARLTSAGYLQVTTMKTSGGWTITAQAVPGRGPQQDRQGRHLFTERG